MATTQKTITQKTTMMRTPWLRTLWTCSLALAGTFAAADDSKLVVRDVNVSFVAKGSMNDRSSFRGSLPGVVLSQRPAYAKANESLPQPLGVITFEGTPHEKLDVLLEYDGSARMLARWPHVDQRSTRTLWRNFDLVNSKAPPTSPFPTNSWLNPLRSADRLGVSLDQKVEKFVLYDMTLRAPNAVELESADTGYKARNFGTAAIHDVTVYRPLGDGKFRAAYIASMPGVAKPAVAPDAAKPPMPAATPAAQPAPGLVVQALTALSGTAPARPAPATATPAPAAAAAPAPAVPQQEINWSGEAQTPDALIAAWEPLLAAQGLGAAEIAHVQSILRAYSFDKDSARVIFRLDPAAIETLAPLEVSPQPDKLQRIWLVILDGADPEIKTRISTLIATLGENSYQKRMEAKAELLKLGPTAVPQLSAEKGNKDPEIAFRIEEILEEVQNPTDQSANAAEAVGIELD